MTAAPGGNGNGSNGHGTQREESYTVAPNRLFKVTLRDGREELIYAASYAIPHENVVAFLRIFYQRNEEIHQMFKAFNGWTAVEELILPKTTEQTH